MEKNDDENMNSTNETNQNKNEQFVSNKDFKYNLMSTNNECNFSAYNPVTVDGVRSYVQYTVNCSLLNKDNRQVEIFKRYSDFDCLRAKLLERWPGIYVPNIPHKKIVGNMDNEFISLRLKLINKFCLKISQLPHLFNSEELMFFLKADDVEKTLNKLPKEGYDEILMKYKKVFVNSVKEDSSATDQNITKCTNFMNKVLLKTLNSIKVSHFKFRHLKT